MLLDPGLGRAICDTDVLCGHVLGRLRRKKIGGYGEIRQGAQYEQEEEGVGRNADEVQVRGGSGGQEAGGGRAGLRLRPLRGE